jgi:hypothetical protein
MFAFASLLYNNLRGGEMYIKAKVLAEAFIFQTTFLYQGYYTTNTQTKNIILILQMVNYNVEFYPLRELKMCYVIVFTCTPHYLIICR